MGRRNWPHNVKRLAVALSLALAVLLGASTPAFGHNVSFTIWLYGSDVTSGTDQHYWTGPLCYGCSLDYWLSTNETVWQSYAGQANFYWEWLNLPGGGVFHGGTACYGHNTWIYDGLGNAHAVADLFGTVINSTPYYVGAAIWNNGSQGYWYQDSGFINGTSCYNAYTQADRMVVIAGQ